MEYFFQLLVPKINVWYKKMFLGTKHASLVPTNAFWYPKLHFRISKMQFWKPKINFEEGLEKTIEWYKSNKSWAKNTSKEVFGDTPWKKQD